MHPNRRDRLWSAVPGIATLAALPLVGLAAVWVDDETFSDSGKGIGVVAVLVVSAIVGMAFAPAVVIGATGPATRRGLRQTTMVVPIALVSAFAYAYAVDDRSAFTVVGGAIVGAALVNWSISLRA